MKGLLNKRKERRLTQEKMAEELNMPPQTYRNYESGRREPKFKTLKMMAEYFNCSIDELL